LARNRYGWQKRAKEMARKEKNDEKMKRRQGKAITPPADDLPEVVEEGIEGLSGSDLPAENPASPSQ
jgi:hypothetical protein